MRFFAVHDSSGNITSLVGCPPKGPVMAPLQLAANQVFSEVSLPARLFNPDNPKTYARLADVPMSYVVQMPLRKPAKLVQKPPVDTSGQGKLATLTITPNPVSRWLAPRYDVTLKEAGPRSLPVQLLLEPDTLIASIVIPAGQTMYSVSKSLPSPLASGTHLVRAIGDEGDSVSAELLVI